MVLNNTCECMPTLRKNEYRLVHVQLCNSATASSSWKLLRTYLEFCANIVQAVVYRLPSCRTRAGPPSSALLRPPALLPPSCRPSSCNPLQARIKNPFQSTLAHDAVAAAVLHKHHPVIRLIQFVYGSRSHLAHGGYPPFLRGSYPVNQNDFM